MGPAPFGLEGDGFLEGRLCGGEVLVSVVEEESQRVAGFCGIGGGVIGEGGHGLDGALGGYTADAGVVFEQGEHLFDEAAGVGGWFGGGAGLGCIAGGEYCDR